MRISPEELDRPQPNHNFITPLDDVLKFLEDGDQEKHTVCQSPDLSCLQFSSARGLTVRDILGTVYGSEARGRRSTASQSVVSNFGSR